MIECLAQPERLTALSAVDWDRLLPQAREAQMLATLWTLLQEQGNAGAPPEPVRFQLWGAWLLAQRRATAILWELRCLATELPVIEGGRPVLLKGAAYIVRDLPGARSRLCGDIDLLIPRGEIDRVERMLYWSGWSRGQLDPYDAQYYRQ
ncbi:MAG: nucleotidyltransferase family protein, partial [Halofilum sp. (in: g-proteobacteria)]